MQRLLAVLIIVALPVIYFLYFHQNSTPFSWGVTDEGPVVRIGEVPIRIEIADTAMSRARGLSGRRSLGSTNGMLFIFDKADYHQIWMKEMYLVIDVIWIDENFKVIGITKALRPDTYPKTFEPPSPARFVIEVNGNFSESFGIRVGDKVTIPEELIPADLRTEG